MLLELPHLHDPMFEGVELLGLLRQFEHIHRLGRAHQLEHLLLAVAGGLRHNQVRPIQEGVLPCDLVAEGGFDQRAEIGRQMLFRSRDSGRRSAAQAHGHPPRCQDDLARRKLAHDPYYRPPCTLCGFGIIVTMIDHASEPRERACRLIARRG